MSRALYRVIVADDVEEVRFLLRRTLERSGRFVVVAEAANGKDAIGLTRRRRPDLVVLDLAMPDVDGLEALREIRSSEPSTVLVALSSFGPQRMADPVREAGGAAYLEKGLGPDRLVEALLAAVQAGGPPPSAAVPAAIRPVRKLFTRDVRSCAPARRFVREVIEAWGHGQAANDELTEVAVLLTSELVANAVDHAGSDIEVSVLLESTSMRVEVHDRRGGRVEPRQARYEDARGRGLAIVDALATRWGTELVDVGKIVWFELALVRQPEPDGIPGRRS